MAQQSGPGTLAIIGLFMVGLVILGGLLYWWLRPQPQVVLIWAVAGLGGATIPAALIYQWQSQAQAHATLLKDGLLGIATIVRAQSTGAFVQRKPEMRLTLRIELPGQAPYEQEVAELMPAGQAAPPGRRMFIRVDKNDRKRVSLDWNGEAPGPAEGSTTQLRARTLADRMSELEDAKKRGLISEEEYRQKRERLLTEL